VFKRFPLLSPLKYLFVPLAKLSSLAAMERNAKASVLRRIDRRGKTEHPDLFDFVLPIDAPLPGSKAELYHLGSTSMQLVGAGFGPMADWYYGTLFYLLEEPKCLELVVNESQTWPVSAESPICSFLLVSYQRSTRNARTNLMDMRTAFIRHL
jgi:hypothetical protein